MAAGCGQESAIAPAVDGGPAAADREASPEGGPARDGPDGGSICIGPIACDDGQPCTEDICGASGKCEHRPIVDGTACDDDDACTTGDACASGACKGASRSSAAAIVGQLTAFGGDGAARRTYDDGLTVPLPGGLALSIDPIATGTRLTLLRVGTTAIEVLDARVSEMPFTSSWDSLRWYHSPTVAVMPLARDRLAIAGSNYGIELYDLSARSLRREAQLLDHADMLAGAAHEQWIWLCRRAHVQGVHVEDDGSLAAGPSLALADATCSDVGLSRDGRTLWVATLERGMVAADVSAPRAPRWTSRRALDGVALGRVHARDGRLVTQEVRIERQLGSIVVLDEATLAEVARFDATPRTRTPFGAAILDGGGVLVTWARASAGLRELVAVRYALDVSAPPDGGVQGARKLDELVYHQAQGEFDAWFMQLASPLVAPGAADENIAVVYPSRRLLRMPPSGIREVTAARHGAFSVLHGASPASVMAYGPRSASFIDLTDPTRPVARAGGLLPPAWTAGLHVAKSWDAARERVALVSRRSWDVRGYAAGPDGIEVYETPSVRVNRLDERAGLAPEPGAVYRMGAGPARVIAAGAGLYQLAPSEGSFQLRLFAIPKPPPPASQELAPRVVQTLEATSKARMGERSPLWRFAADDATGELLIADHSFTAGTFLRWYARGPSGFELRARLDRPGVTPWGLLLRGAEAVLLTEDRVELLRRSGGAIESVASIGVPSTGGTFGDLVDFDGRRIYVGTHDGPRWQLHVLDLTTSRSMAHYDTENPVRAIANAGDYWLLGTGTSLYVASPSCSGSFRVRAARATNERSGQEHQP
ncbi:hypothetical protein [Pendulispora albinea]|uniref:Uncharacterized protein n=1 Tax=Pendulispora albinea TaxID=2741071 RepID=A0ABZ2M0L0_9BACT